jgi:hypothetical protein
VAPDADGRGGGERRAVPRECGKLSMLFFQPKLGAARSRMWVAAGNFAESMAFFLYVVNAMYCSTPAAGVSVRFTLLRRKR